MKYKVSELEGAPLDAAVAKAEGRLYDMVNVGKHGVDFITVVDPEQSGWVAWSPSRLWEDGGPIIERERIALMLETEVGPWYACVDHTAGRTSKGSTPLIAAMRAFVASKFGEEVEL